MPEFDSDQLKSNPISEVQLESSVLLKIMKHCRDHTVSGNGQLLGMEINGVLQVTHCFPVATKAGDDEVNETEDSEYQLSMMRNLRKLNFDANAIGWYQSTYLGSHWNQILIETQYEYQKALEHAVVLLYDPTQTFHGSVSLKAMRLTDKFMKFFSTEKKFSMSLLAQHKLTPRDIFQYLPLKIRNSNLSHALLYHLEDLSSSPLNQVKAEIESTPAWSFQSKLPEEIAVVNPSFEVLEQRSTLFLEKHLEYLSETVDELGQEQWRWHGWQRNYAKEKQKIAYVVSKRKQENEKRAAQGLEPAYAEDDLEMNSVHLQRLIKNEPSRLESLVIHNQLFTYCRQVEDFSSTLVSKMQGIRSLQESSYVEVPSSSNTTDSTMNTNANTTTAAAADN